MTKINRQEVTDYLAMYNVPAFLIDLICEDELGADLVKGWHNAQLEYRYKVLAAIERFDLYADGQRIEQFIWDAVTEHPRLFTSYEKEYLKCNRLFRQEILQWYQSSLSDGYWSSEENVQLMQQFQREAAIEKVLSEAAIHRPVWNEKQWQQHLGLTEIQAREIERISRISAEERSVKEWQYVEAIWQYGFSHAVGNVSF